MTVQCLALNDRAALGALCDVKTVRTINPWRGLSYWAHVANARHIERGGSWATPRSKRNARGAPV